MMRYEKSDGLHSSDDVGARERLVTAVRIKYRLCKGILHANNHFELVNPVCGSYQVTKQEYRR